MWFLAAWAAKLPVATVDLLLMPPRISAHELLNGI